MNTKVFKLAYEFLKSKSKLLNFFKTKKFYFYLDKADENLIEFRKKLFTLWFGTYSRCEPNQGSSGKYIFFFY